jgi:hypothetical protein
MTSRPASASPSPLPLGEGSPESDSFDPELLALPSPPREERRLTIAIMTMTMIASLWMVVALRGEVSYALRPSSPLDLDELTAAMPPPQALGNYVRASGLLSSTQAIRYQRPMEGDSFRLAPLANNNKIWVEIRVPEGMEGPKFAPPTHFVGRLVPFSSAGIRHAGLTTNVTDAHAGKVLEGSWLLIDGSSPRASRWAIALVGLFLYFAGWNAFGIFKLLRPVKDS